MKRILLLMGMMMTLTGATVSADTYEIDPRLSTVSFDIRHQVGLNSGFIKQFEGSVEEKKSELRAFTLTADMTSLTTFNERRDEIARSADYFGVEQFPEAVIKSRKIKDGEMTASVKIKDTTKDVLFRYRILGKSRNKDGKETLVLTLEGDLNKEDFGMTYSTQTESGKSNIGDTLHLVINIEAVKK